MGKQLAQEIIDTIGRWGLIQVELQPHKPPKEDYVFFGIDKEQMLIIRKKLQLGKLTKSMVFGNISYEGENFTFRNVTLCKITDYKEETIPKHVKKTPIYDCQET